MPPFGPDQLTDNDVDMVIRYLQERLPACPATESAERPLAADSREDR